MDDRESDELLLGAMKEARKVSGLPLDFWADLTDGIPHNFAAILCGRSFLIPKYMNSKVSP